MYCIHCGKRMTKAVAQAEEPAAYLCPCGRVQVQATSSTLLTFPDGMTAAGQLPTLFQSDLFGNPPHGYCST